MNSKRQQHIENLEQLFSATDHFGRDTSGRKELRETIRAAIESMTRELRLEQEGN